jgi:type II secretory pathway component PulF
MSPYKYTALDRNGLCHTGYTFSEDIKGLIHLLEKRHLFLVSYRKILYLEQWVTLKRARKEIANFFLHLKYMTHAGMGITPALQGFSPGPGFTAILHQIVSHIQNGKLLSEAMAFYPSLFDSFVLATVRMGEKTSQMGQAFDICFSYVTHREKLKKQIQEAVRYPLFLLAVLGGVITFLFSTVIPALLDFIQHMGHTLSLSTRLLIHGVDLFQTYGWMALIACASAGFLCIILPPLRQQVHGCKYCLPYLGKLLIMLDLSAFFQQLFMLQSGGVPLLESLNIAQKTNGNLYWQSKMEIIKNAIKNGHKISEAFAQHALIPSFVIQLLETGEQSGAFLPALHHLGEILDHKTAYKIHYLISLLNPMFMLLVGALLLWIVMAIFLPLYEVVV